MPGLPHEVRLLSALTTSENPSERRCRPTRTKHSSLVATPGRPPSAGGGPDFPPEGQPAATEAQTCSTFPSDASCLGARRQTGDSGAPRRTQRQPKSPPSQFERYSPFIAPDALEWE